MSEEKKVWNEESLKEAIKEQWGKFGSHMVVFHMMLDFINSMKWTVYSWDNKASHPPCAGRYLIHRKGCDKTHFEQWNGSGWSSSNGDCTHWRKPDKPNKFNIKCLQTKKNK